MKVKIDPFIVALLTTVAVATVVPCRGSFATVMSWVTDAAIALLFFLHGAKLSREAVLAGLGAWRIHTLVFISTFVMFPIMGLLLQVLGRGWLNPLISGGILYLCLLPSTVQSSIAFTSIAKGNVPAAVCSASSSNLLGFFVTPFLVSLLLGTKGVQLSFSSVQAIALQLLAPFILGHLSRPLTAKLLVRWSAVVNRVDRGSILLVVYTAFSAAVIQGLWQKFSPSDLALTVALNGVILAIALFTTTWSARRLHFSRPDEVAVVFCGSKKSLASGVPMAGVLFPPAILGPMILPLMLFHQMQLMACAFLAQRYADRYAQAEVQRSVEGAAAAGPQAA